MEEVRFICGFKELCNPQFYYNLVLGEEEEQRIYIKRKIELEKILFNKGLLKTFHLLVNPDDY